jgi:predicted dehydrogenase
VVGAGYWGPNLLRNFQQSPDFRLHWLCDVQEDRARAVIGSYSTVRTTASLADVLADEAVECVAIATPAHSHHDVALAAIEAGKHVLVEKPLASTFDEGQALVDAAAARGVVLMCDHTFCYTPAVAKIRELVHGGRPGRPAVHRLGTDQSRARPARRRRALGPRPARPVDPRPHPPDGVRPLSVAAHGADPIGAGRACIAYLTLTLPGGAIAHMHVNWLSPTKVRTTMVSGAKRTLVWDDLHPTQRISVFDRGWTSPRARSSVPSNGGKRWCSTAAATWWRRPCPSGRRSARSWPSSPSRSGPAARRVPTAAPGLRVLDILEAASQSLEFRGAVVPLRGMR